MRRLTIIALSLAGIVAAAAVATPVIVSARLANMDLADRIGAWTGEQVTVHGEPDVILFPSLGVEVKDVVVSGIAGAGREPTMTIPLVRASLNIVPLLAGRVGIGTLTLVEPHIHIASRQAGDVKGSAADPVAAVSGFDDVRIDEIILRNGSITYDSQHAGDGDPITAVNLRFARLGEARAAGLSGTFEWRSALVKIAAKADDVPAIFDGTGSNGRLRLAAARARSSVDDRADAAGQDARSGENVRSNQSLRQVVERLGIPIAPRSTFGPLLVAGTLALGETSLTLSDATLAIDGDAADGDVTVRIGGGGPMLRGSLVFDKLDLDDHLDRPLRTFLGELFAAPLSSGWLSRADIDLTVSAREVDLGGNQITDASATLLARGGRMALALSEANLAGGRMTGQLGIETGQESISAHLAACLDDVSVAQVAGLFRPVGHNPLIGTEEPLRGTGTAALELAAGGDTMESFTGSISGVFIAHVRDGTVGGIDVESTLERLVDGNTVIGGGNAPFVPVTGRTEFDLLSTYVPVDAGVARDGGMRLYGDRYYVSLFGGGDLSRGEIEMEGVALLFDPGTSAGQRYLQPLVQLPFGAGGTIRKPMIVPGIPRVGYGPHKHPETEASTAHSGLSVASTLSAASDESHRSGSESSGDGVPAPASTTNDRVGVYRDALARCGSGTVP